MDGRLLLGFTLRFDRTLTSHPSTSSRSRPRRFACSTSSSCWRTTADGSCIATLRNALFATTAWACAIGSVAARHRCRSGLRPGRPTAGDRRGLRVPRRQGEFHPRLRRSLDQEGHEPGLIRPSIVAVRRPLRRRGDVRRDLLLRTLSGKLVLERPFLLRRGRYGRIASAGTRVARAAAVATIRNRVLAVVARIVVDAGSFVADVSALAASTI